MQPPPRTKLVDALACQNPHEGPPEVQMIDVAELQSHPRQAKLMGDMPAAGYSAFAAEDGAKWDPHPFDCDG